MPTDPSHAARIRNIDAMREHVKSLQAAQRICIVSAITPYAAMRERNAHDIPCYNEIWIKCPLAELSRRDTKGLYAKASHGDLNNLTGVGDSFDLPLMPDLVIDTSLETQQESFKHLSSFVLDKLCPDSSMLPLQDGHRSLRAV